MALFGTKKKEVKKAKKAGAGDHSVSGAVLIRPHMTEKAAHLSARHVYIFTVLPSATKTEVAKAIHAVYGVLPKKVHMVKSPGRRVHLRNRRGTGKRSDQKRAFVYLKEGDRIEFAA